VFFGLFSGNTGSFFSEGRREEEEEEERKKALE
jgi:hypothetical protein